MIPEVIAYTDFGKHKIRLEKYDGTYGEYHVIQTANDKEYQHLEYGLTEELEAWRDYNLICQTIKYFIDSYGSEITIFKKD